MKIHLPILLIISTFLIASCEDKVKPVDPTPDPSESEAFDVRVTAVDGILDENGVVSNPKFTIVIENAEEANYTITYSLDGKDGKLERVFPEEEHSLLVSGSTSVGKHVLSGKATRDATGEEVPFSADAWLRWSPLSKIEGTLSYLDVKKEFSSKADTVDRDVSLTVDVTFMNAKTPVEYQAYNHESVNLESIERIGDGHIRMTAVTTAKSDNAWVGMVLVNGNLRDTVSQKIICTGKATEKQHVTDFTIDGFEGSSVTIPMKEELSFTVHPLPATAVDAGEVSVVIDDTETATVKEQDGVWTVTPVWVGTTSMKITAGSISKTYPLTVTGTPVSGFSIANSFTSTEWVTGTSVTDFITPIPSDAFDADEITVKSLQQSVIKVTKGGGGAYTLTALRYGSAEVEISTPHCKKTFEITVHQDIDLSGLNGSSISWRDERSFTVNGNYSDFSIVSSTDNCWTLSRSGNTLSITNTMEKGGAPRQSRSATLTLRTADGYSYSATFTLGAVPNSTSSSIRYVRDAEGGSKAVVRLKFVNGTDNSIDFKRYEGFLLSRSAATDTHITTACERLKAGSSVNLYDGGSAYAIFYNFLDYIPGIEMGDALTIPSLTIKEYDITLPASGDGYGRYSNGFNGVMRSCPDGPSEEWTYWTF